MRLATGCSAIDALLEGGIESGTVTELYGGGGSGKTNLCLQLAKNVAVQGSKVIYIDTEGVSAERLSQIAGEDSEKVMSNVLFFRAHSYAEQEKFLNKAVKLSFTENMDVELLIVDSLTIFYRALLKDEEEQNVSSRLGNQLIQMLRLARKKEIPVVVTTQVYQSQDKNQPVGGHILYHSAKTIIELDDIGPHIRLARIIKHRSIAEKQSVEFKITNEGLVSLGSD